MRWSSQSWQKYFIWKKKLVKKLEFLKYVDKIWDVRIIRIKQRR